MAIIQCPECKKEVSSCATQCVGCGFPLQTEEIGTEQNQPQSESLITGVKKRAHAQFLAAIVGFGSHNFYLGFFKKAIIQLLIMVVGFSLLLIGAIGMIYWLTDSFSFFATEYLIVFICGIPVIIGGVVWNLVDWHFIKSHEVKTDAKGRPLI